MNRFTCIDKIIKSAKTHPLIHTPAILAHQIFRKLSLTTRVPLLVPFHVDRLFFAPPTITISPLLLHTTHIYLCRWHLAAVSLSFRERVGVFSL